VSQSNMSKLHFTNCKLTTWKSMLLNCPFQLYYMSCILSLPSNLVVDSSFFNPDKYAPPFLNLSVNAFGLVDFLMCILISPFYADVVL